MKFLHTADLHIGKTLHEVSLEEQQEQMLKSIIEILGQDDYAALLISGDVYDRSMPSAGAVTLFGNFLAKIKSCFPNLSVLIIPGNHDSSLRLSYASELLESQAIHIAKDTSKITTPIIISHNGENVEFFLLPFLQTGAFSVEIDDKKERLMTTQAEMAEEASKRLKKAVSKDIPSVLLAHLFTIGGKNSSTERPFIGTAEYVEPSLFSYFDYVALGHLHRFQKVTDRMYYSGAPLAYAFDECEYEKYVLSVEIDTKNLDALPIVKPIAINPMRKLRRISGKFHDLLENVEFNVYADDYLEITLTNDSTVENPTQMLRGKFPHLMNVKQASFMKKIDADTELDITNYDKIENNLLESFKVFSNNVDVELKDDEIELFTKLYKELSNET